MGIDQHETTVQFTVLSEAKRRAIHAAAADVLAGTGLLIMHDRAVRLLADAGCVVEGQLVRFPKALVADCVAAAPGRVDIYTRDGEPAMALHGRNVYFGTGCDCMHVIDVRTQQRRPAVLADVAEAALITDALSEVDFHMSMATPMDVPPTLADRYQVAAMLRSTRKPFAFTCYSLEAISDIYDMCQAVAGSVEALVQRPFALSFLNTISPLTKSPEMLDKLIFGAERRLPTIDISGPSAGATSPATFAGTLVTSIAESLAGLVLSQVVCPGTPFIFGANLHVMDMATMTHPYGGPELPLMNAAMSEMAQFYELPMFSGGGCSDAHTFDQQAAVEAALSILMAGLSGGNMVHNLGYLGNGITSSLELVCLGNELIDIVRRMLRGIEVSPETLATDVIADVGPGGNYLAEDHTVAHFRGEFWFPHLFARDFHENWRDKLGGLTLGARLRRRVLDILAEHEPPPLSERAERAVAAVLGRAAARSQGT